MHSGDNKRGRGVGVEVRGRCENKDERKHMEMKYGL
jgi:hypothetical protein